MRRIDRFKWLALGVLCLWAAVVSAAGEEPKTTNSVRAKQAIDTSNFMRVVRDEKKRPIAMETSIVHYVPRDRSKSHPTVDLVSAFHIGEKKYYRDLNKAFEKYDVVLYELVAPLGTRVPKGGAKSDSMLSKVQKFMKDTLELEFQLDQIDYTKPNFVHADMSPDDIAKSMADNDESWFTVMSRMMSYSMAQQAKTGGNDGSAELLFALFSKNRALALKRSIANQLALDESIAALEGPTGSTLISGRNKIAIDVLRKEIEAGKRRIAIFYGGGHMPDMDNRLRAEFKLAPASTRWMTAWDLKEKKPKKAKHDNKDSQHLLEAR